MERLCIYHQVDADRETPRLLLDHHVLRRITRGIDLFQHPGDLLRPFGPGNRCVPLAVQATLTDSRRLPPEEVEQMAWAV